MNIAWYCGFFLGNVVLYLCVYGLHRLKMRCYSVKGEWDGSGEDRILASELEESITSVNHDEKSVLI
jgi:hypothetical protein